MRFFIGLISSLVLASTAEYCGREQWEGIVLEQVAWGGDKPGFLELQTSISMDMKNRKQFLDVEPFGMTIYKDFNKKLAWTVQNGTCKTQYNGEEPEKWCKPDKSEYQGRFKLGGDDTVDLIHSYYKDGFSLSQFMDTKLQVPSFQSIAMEGRYIVQAFANVTEGIKDEKIFDLPDICEKKDVCGTYKEFGL